MVDITQFLVIGIGVNGRHQAALNTNAIGYGFHHGCEAVSGAGGVGDDVVIGGQGVIIDAVYDGGISVGRGCRNNHLAGTSAQVGCRGFVLGEQAGALEHDIDMVIFPGQ